MTKEKSLIQDMKKGVSEVQEHVSEALHSVWPFRSKESRETGERETVLFPADIYETEDGFVLVGEMPGVDKKGIHVHVSENELTITGHFQAELGNKEQVILHEIPGADYRRSFTLSDAVDREKISAELKEGVLTVHLAKSESVKPREIEITTSP